MKNKLFQRVVCLILSVTLLSGSIGLTASAASLKVDTTGEEKYPYSASTLEEMQDLVGTLSYDEYLASFGGTNEMGAGVISVDVLDVIEGNGVLVSASDACLNSMNDYPELWSGFGAENADKSVYLPSQGSTTWKVDVSNAAAGLYYLKIEYYTPETSESSISSIERKLKIDGKIPFDEVSTVKFDKNWQYDNIDVVTSDAVGEPDSYNVEYTDKDGAYKRITTSVRNGVKTVTTYTLSQDINGNSMAPSPSALPSWSTTYVKDHSGYYTGYFSFYFAYGSHTITLEAEREPMIIKSMELVPADNTSAIPSYEQYIENYKANGLYTPAANGSIIEIQAEFPDLVSDSSVAPTNDNSSAVNEPISSSAQLYNVIGENSYSSVGQWAAYKFQVTESGLYNLGMRFNQSTLQGMFVCRTIKLSGGAYGLADGSPTIPFAEAYNTTFNYDKNWQSEYLGADVTRTAQDGTTYTEREDFLFYFEEGVEYTLYLECSLGTLKSYIQRVEDSLAKINSCYLNILQLTGTDPDEYRDYNFVKIMPEVLVTLLEEAVTLMEVKEGLEVLCGTNGSHIATLETVAILLNTMGKNNGDEIAVNLSQLKSYLGTLGTWINDSKLGSMKVDSIWVVPAEQDGEAFTAKEKSLPRANANFFQTCWHEIKSFVSSFFVEYDQMGLTTEIDEDTHKIDVWLATGRDQSQIWRSMVDAHGGFTYNTGTAVSLKLVTAGTLLPSILSGKGPDVYMGLGAADVINYAIRNAIIGIGGEGVDPVFTTERYTYRDAEGNYTTTTEYQGETNLTFVTKPFNNVIEGNFADAAMDTVTLLNTSYGIPQTMAFAMMFYRMDVLANLGLEVPESWDQLLSVLPVLQSNNMSIGVSYISALDFMIYQLGGSMWKYTDETKYSSEYAGARIDLDSNVALEAFNFTCRLYTDYSFPVSFDAANRFRTGEIPIIISDYATLYNTLVVYATEIEGLWEFCSLPGSKRADGSFNYDSLAGITANVILHGCDDLVSAWQFTQWSTGSEAQSTYGNKMVALIGPSAKYETANLSAINNLSWTASEKEAIMNQMEHLSSIVNYPGSYIITRYTQFAFLDAVNDSVDPQDAMTGYIEAINTEIARKREEFGLWVPANSEDEPPELSATPID
ncbi:MAG: extracellular solute-binding protein [Clostridia bacterium]|nr:extracellular solute-binding protein [Clostridia bacterium]